MRWTVVLLLLLVAAGCSRRSEQDRAPEAGPAPSPVAAGPIDMSGASVEVPELRLPSLAPLVARITATVVSLVVDAAPEIPPGHERFFRRRGDGRGPSQQRAGSGFIVDSSGLIVTNNHVVRGARSIAVVLEDGRRLDATLVGRDGPTDLALVRLENPPADLAVATVGDSELLKVGDWLLAVGNPFGLASSVSLGILSATARDLGAGPYDEFLQTDAAINPGNSGGPLFDMKGEVVGVNTAIAGPGTSIGFAVPSSMVSALLPILKKSGGVTRGALGVYLQDLTPELATALGLAGRRGAIVSGFTPDSGARAAGLARDDVIVSLDGRPIESARTLTRLVGMHRPGETVQLELLRGGEARTVRVKLGTRTDLEGTGPLLPSAETSEAGASVHLGLQIGELTPDVARLVGVRRPGAMIVSVEPGSAAERAGMRPGLVIVEVAGRPVHSAEEAAAFLRDARTKPPVVVRLRGPGKMSAVATVRP